SSRSPPFLSSVAISCHLYVCAVPTVCRNPCAARKLPPMTRRSNLSNEGLDGAKNAEVNLLLRDALRLEFRLRNHQRMIAAVDNMHAGWRRHATTHFLKDLQRAEMVARP